MPSQEALVTRAKKSSSLFLVFPQTSNLDPPILYSGWFRFGSGCQRIQRYLVFTFPQLRRYVVGFSKCHSLGVFPADKSIFLWVFFLLSLFLLGCCFFDFSPLDDSKQARAHSFF